MAEFETQAIKKGVLGTLTLYSVVKNVLNVFLITGSTKSVC